MSSFVRRGLPFAAMRFTARPVSRPRWQRFAVGGASLLASGVAIGALCREKRYTPEEVARHNGGENGTWVTYKEGVYDITPFIDQHPGGDLFGSVAGKSIDADWEALPFHVERALKILEEHRVGRLKGQQQQQNNDPYVDQPTVSPDLTVRTDKPLNADPKLEQLAGLAGTPENLLYVRTHYATPDLSPEGYAMDLVLFGIRSSLTLEDIQKNFDQHSLVAVQACAGNRRADTEGTSGTPWEAAVGNPTYSGARVKEVLRKVGADAGLEEDDLSDLILYVTAHDGSPSGAHYNTAISWEQIPEEALFADKMNGEPLTRLHGAPVRLLIPGRAAHYSIKHPERLLMVHRDTVVAKPEFAGLSESVAKTLTLSKAQQSYLIRDREGEIIGFAGELPVQSQILDVTVETGGVTLRGYASSGAGREVTRQELSWDGGATWRDVTMGPGTAYGWRQWACTVPRSDLPSGEVQFLARATDASGRVQPERSVWNKRGLFTNEWDRRSVELKD
jgi:sulfite oxidase